MGAGMSDKDKRLERACRAAGETLAAPYPQFRGGFIPSFDRRVEASQSAEIRALKERLAALEDRVKWLEMGRR